jgi:hypothetical protein
VAPVQMQPLKVSGADLTGLWSPDEIMQAVAPAALAFYRRKGNAVVAGQCEDGS